jgi:hypothetical protein
VFHLVRADQAETAPDEDIAPELKRLSLEQLKQKAYEAATDGGLCCK